MKNIHIYIILLTLSFLMLSCNVGKKVKPLNQKINGPLGDYYQLVQNDYSIKDGRIVVGLKRIGEGTPVPMKTNATLGDCDECYELRLMAEFMDKDGNVLTKSYADFRSVPEQLESLMALKLNETAHVSFNVNTKGISCVKMLSDFVYHGTATSNMSGIINGSMSILMSIEFSSQGEAKGGYYHERFGSDAMLYLMGKLEGQCLTLDEYSFEGKRIGEFKGIFKDGDYKGVYESFDGKTYSFSLAENSLMYPVDYSGIDFASLSDEPAFNVNNKEDYEQFYQGLFESQGILLSVKDTMHLVLNKTELKMKIGDCDTLILTSYDSNMPITWFSSDESVAMVGSSGVVRAIGEGEAFIMASVRPTKRDTVTTSAYVKVNAPAKKKDPSSSKPQKTSSIDLGYATYEPLPQDNMTGVKDGKPHGNGIMRFKSSHLIPGTQDCVAEAGEWVNGMWRDGKINVGTWYSNDGNQVIVKLGQRYNK